VIRETFLSTALPAEDGITDPPSGILRLVVIGEIASLDWAPTDAVGERTAPPWCSFQVSARSLLLALQAAWDDNHPRAAPIDHPHPPPVPDPETASRAANSHQPSAPDGATATGGAGGGGRVGAGEVRQKGPPT
jgi:hypothetical protein